MPDYNDPIGKGGAWINTSKAGRKFLSGEITFSYNGHQVTAKFVAFRNDKKEGKQPDYNIIVNDAFPAKTKEQKPKEKEPEPPKQDEDIPF